MKISKEYLDKNFKRFCTDKNGVIFYTFTKKYAYCMCYTGDHINIEDAPYLLIDTQEKLEKFKSLINPEWKS